MVQVFESLHPVLQFLALLGAAMAVPAAVVGALYNWTLKPRLVRLDRALEAVEYHLKPNGHEDELSADERDQPVRLLVIRLAAQLKEVRDALRRDLTWQQQHDLRHARSDGRDEGRAM